MLNVEVNMHGQLRRFLPDGNAVVRLQMPEGSTVGEIAALLDAQDEVWLSAIGDVVVSLSTPLADDDVVHFFSILEGG